MDPKRSPQPCASQRPSLPTGCVPKTHIYCRPAAHDDPSETPFAQRARLARAALPNTSRARRPRRRRGRCRGRSERLPALVLSPHWDDAVLSCWSMLSASGELSVVNVFAAPRPSRDAGARGRRSRDWPTRASGRVRGSRRTHARCALVGRRAHNLELAGDPAARRPRRGRRARRWGGHWRRASREPRVCTRPAGIGGHVDHVLARRCARRLLQRGMPVTLYAELPYCVTHGWPAWVGGARATRHGRRGRLLAGVPDRRPGDAAAARGTGRAPRRRGRRREAAGDRLL